MVKGTSVIQVEYCLGGLATWMIQPYCIHTFTGPHAIGTRVLPVSIALAESASCTIYGTSTWRTTPFAYDGGIVCKPGFEVAWTVVRKFYLAPPFAESENEDRRGQRAGYDSE